MTARQKEHAGGGFATLVEIGVGKRDPRRECEKAELEENTTGRGDVVHHGADGPDADV